MAWLYLFLAGLFEIVWSTALKYSVGFSQVVPSIITILGMALSVFFLGIAMRHIPISTAYTIWTAIGAVGSVAAGIFLFNEAISISKLFCLCIIILGVIGVKIFST